MAHKPTLDAGEFRLMRDYIEKQCGIDLGDEKMYLVQARLCELIVESGCPSFSAFYLKAKADATGRLRDRVVDAITTHETLWFRDRLPYAVLEQVLLPAYSRESSASRRRLRIWSAACSTGQEPYSIAMIVAEFARTSGSIDPKQIDIIGTDISTSALALAKGGRYDAIAMARGLDATMTERYFDRAGKEWTIRDEVRGRVTFRHHNLQDSFAFLAPIDIVFCRNVLIYFSDSFKSDILSRIAKVLSPKGVLFVGASESLINHSSEYALVKHEKALYYRATRP